MAALAVLIALPACGVDAGAANSVEPMPLVTMVEPPQLESADADGDLPRPAPEARIVPVDGDLAEIVFALGLGGFVVASDLSATYPPAADALPQIGYQRALAPEPILAHEPSIVLATDIAGPTETLEDLERLGVEVAMIDVPSSAAGPGEKIRAVAEALDVAEVGAELAAVVDAQIADAASRVVGASQTPRVAALYVRGQNVQLLLGEGSGIDWLIDAAGGIDIADELGVVENAPINAEALVLAAPDVVILPQGGLDSVGGLDGLLGVAGIAETPAGQQLRIFAYDDQYMLGNGPRTGAFLDDLITDLHGDI
ncbi:MAG: hemin ABC transporter substrate-binding protein [Ilumatobacter sp.]